MLRLKTRSQFQAVLACSKLATSTHFAVHQLASDSPSFHSHFAAPGVAQAGGIVVPAPVWLGAMVPKRWARRAVTRNTIKRQIYHVARDLESSLLHGAWVVRQRAGFDKVLFRSATSSHLKDAVRTELQEVLQRAAAGRQSNPFKARRNDPARADGAGKALSSDAQSVAG